MRKHFILFFFILFSITLTSQRNCGTMHYLQQQINENPSLLQKMNDNEVYLQNYIQNSPENNSIPLSFFSLAALLFSTTSMKSLCKSS